MTSDSVEPELQLKMFIVLSKQLFETSDRIDSQKKFGPFAIRVLEGKNDKSDNSSLDIFPQLLATGIFVIVRVTFFLLIIPFVAADIFSFN